MPDQLYVASRNDLDEAILDGLRKTLPFFAEKLACPAKEFLSEREAVEFLDLPHETVQQLRKQGALAYKRLAGNIYYNREDLLRLIREDQADTNEQTQPPSQRTPQT